MRKAHEYVTDERFEQMKAAAQKRGPKTELIAQSNKLPISPVVLSHMRKAHAYMRGPVLYSAGLLMSSGSRSLYQIPAPADEHPPEILEAMASCYRQIKGLVDSVPFPQPHVACFY